MGSWGGRRAGAGRKPKTEAPREPKPQLQEPARRRTGFDVSALIEAIQGSNRRGQRARSREWCPFKIYEHPKPAEPPQPLTMAMDTALVAANESAINAWMAGGLLSDAESEAMLFPGYPYLSALAQRPEYRVMSETIATEMTRKWIEFSGIGNEDKTERIKELVDFLDHIKLRKAMADVAKNDGFFGRSHLCMKGSGDTDDEIKTPIATRDGELLTGKIGPGWLKGLEVIEPVWCYPTTYNAQNPLRPGWYDPQVWYVMGQEIHRSRLLPFVGRPVPDLLKPAYSFGGLSLSQIAQPYVNIWLQTRQSVADIIRGFSIYVLKTNLAQRLSPAGGAADLVARVSMFNAFRDNQGTMVIDKDTEDFQNISASLAGLHELQAQSQEHMMSVSRIPAVKFTGLSPTGLNASDEGQIRAFYDTINAYQPELFDENLTIIIHCAMVTLWGEVDHDIIYKWVPLWSMTEKEEAELREKNSQMDERYVGMGAIDPAEVRIRLATDPTSPYHGLDPDDLPEPPPEEQPPGGPEEGGGEGGGGPGNPPEPDPAGDQGPSLGQDGLFWKESDHPREKSGKFTSGAAGAGGSEPKQTKLESGKLPWVPGRPLLGPGEGGEERKPRSFAPEGWKPSADTTEFKAGAKPPKELNGVKFASWSPPEDWSSIPDAEIDERELDVPEHKEAASGVVMVEPDGRAWLVQPKGAYGGYWHTFPKGRAEEGLSLQQNALKEAWEETGLRAEITGVAGDFEGDETMTRYYLARRVGGTPTDHGEEASAVVLADPKDLAVLLNRARDKTIAKKHVVGDAAWEETKHPRDDDGKFSSGGGGGGGAAAKPAAAKKASNGPAGGVAQKVNDWFSKVWPSKANPPVDPHNLVQISGKKGSNPGGVFEDGNTGIRYYIKQPQSKDHVANEYLAAGLYKLAGVKTLDYQPSTGSYVVTKMEKLGKDNVSKLSEAERQKAREDIAVHAWLANYDAVGTGGDNVGTVGGKVTTLDTGGSLLFRAQGKPKGDMFGENPWDDIAGMMDPNKNPDAAALYKGMTKDQIRESAKKVVAIPDQDIKDMVAGSGLSPALRKEVEDKLIARKLELEESLDLGAYNPDNPEFEAAHKRDASGKFVKMAGEATAENLEEMFDSDEIESLGEALQLADEIHKQKPELDDQLLDVLKKAGATLDDLEEAGMTELADKAMVEAVKHAIPAAPEPPPAAGEAPGSAGAEPSHLPPAAGQMAAYGGLWKPGGANATENLALNANHYLSKPAQMGIHYRRMMTYMAKAADKAAKEHGGEWNATASKLKARLVESLHMASNKAHASGKTDEVNKLTKAINAIEKADPDAAKAGFDAYFIALGKTPPAKPSAAAAAAAKPEPPKNTEPKPPPPPTPPPPPPPSNYPKPTDAELAKAKKSTTLTGQYVPNYGSLQTSTAQTEAQKLIDAFNAKYAGKTLPDSELPAKVNAFKQLNDQVGGIKQKEAANLASYQKQQAEEQKKAQAAAKKQAEEAAKQAAAQNESVMKELGVSQDEATAFNGLLSMLELHGFGGESGKKDFIEKFKKYEASAKTHGLPVSGFEYALIRSYIDGVYKAVNAALRSTSWTPMQHMYARLVNKTIDKVPKYTGTVLRGTDLTSEQIAAYKPGHVISERSFTSTGVGFKFDGNVHYTIKAIGKRGGDFSTTANQSEKEVIFKANTYFLVHKVETKNGITHIEMEEVEHYG